MTGRLSKRSGDEVRRLFLARHPGAAVYADFTDFAFWRLEISQGHFIGGFGRIQMLDRSLLSDDGA